MGRRMGRSPQAPGVLPAQTERSSVRGGMQQHGTTSFNWGRRALSDVAVSVVQRAGGFGSDRTRAGAIIRTWQSGSVAAASSGGRPSLEVAGLSGGYRWVALGD